MIVGDGVVVELSEMEFVGDGVVAFVVIIGETVVDVTAVDAIVVVVDDGVLGVGLRLVEVPACGLVVSGSSVGTLAVVVNIGLVA